MKPGDRVRCTLGDSVIIGKLAAVGMDGTTLHVEVTGNPFDLTLPTPEWTVEVLAPPLPPEPPLGSIVRCADQDGTTAFIRDGNWWLRTGSESAWNWNELLASYGPLTLLIPATQVVADLRALNASALAGDLAEKYGVTT